MKASVRSSVCMRLLDDFNGDNGYSFIVTRGRRANGLERDRVNSAHVAPIKKANDRVTRV